jgi:hypothetical protein
MVELTSRVQYVDDGRCNQLEVFLAGQHCVDIVVRVAVLVGDKIGPAIFASLPRIRSAGVRVCVL